MGLVIVFIVITAMLAANAFYVAAEFAAVSASKPKLSSKAKDGRREADYIEKTVTDEYRMDRYIACAQVGITLTSLVIGFYGQRALAPYLTPLLDGVLPAGIVATAVVAPLLLVVLTMLQVILGELFPKSIALRNPETVAFKTARPMRWSLLVLGPFISLLNGSAIWIMRRFGLDKPKESGEEHSHEELRAVISESLEGGVIGRSAHEMLRQVLAFEERTVAGVMQPRSQIVALAPETTAADALPTMVDAPFTRFPLFRTDDIDQPAGFVHLRDVHAADGTTPLSDIAREIDLVPDTLTL
ncbi:MAG: hemolysin family protein, partial [Ornithinimicrobium sp.]